MKLALILVMNIPHIGHIIYFLGGVTCMVIAIFKYIKLRKFIKNGRYAFGKIVGYKFAEGGDEPIKLPLIRFSIDEDTTVVALGDTDSFNDDDQMINIIYNPENPKEIIINTWTKHSPWIVLLFASLLFFTALIMNLADDN
jgi:hypothetical protein